MRERETVRHPGSAARIHVEDARRARTRLLFAATDV
jgi:hypothetical protein